jgi:hypothetical protein
LQVKDANGTLLEAGFTECSTLLFVITRIIAFLVIHWSQIIVTANEDLPLPMPTTDISSLPADRDETRRFLFLPFLPGLSTSAILRYGQRAFYDASLMMSIAAPSFSCSMNRPSRQDTSVSLFPKE